LAEVFCNAEKRGDATRVNRQRTKLRSGLAARWIWNQLRHAACA